MKEEIQFMPVKTLDEVLSIALSKNKKRGFKLQMAKETPMMPFADYQGDAKQQPIKQ